MKKTITILSLAVNMLTANATTRVVNNRRDLPVNPGQYTTITAAITAASNGDTILVAGSPYNYDSNVLIDKSLTFIGPGYNPRKQDSLAANVAQFTINAGNASGSSIMGFITSVSLSSNVPDVNITIRRCLLGGVSISDSTANLLIAENYFNYSWPYIGVSLSGSYGNSNCKIINNIFINSTSISAGNLPSNTPAVLIDHNLFINGNNGTPLISTGWTATFSSLTNAIITNNIFYNMDGSSSTTNCTYNNNITFAGAALPLLPSAGNVGSGNINNTSPLFVSIFNTSNTVDFNLDNLRLQNGSPAHNAATNNTDIEPTGGSYPIYQSTNLYLTGEPTIPEIKVMNFVGASATKPGGTLQINVKAKKIN